VVKWITGLFGMSLVVIFLGYYVIQLPFPPLWLIIIGVLAMALTDFVQTMRENGDKNGK